MKPMKRAVHFDFHTMPGIDNICENFDAEKFAQQMEDANVGYVNFFARCNIGFSYYSTKVGIKYPGLKSNLLGDVVKACHKRGIGVTGYLNIGLHHEMAIIHPEWLKMNKDGKIYNFNEGGNFFRNMCTNTGYLDHFISEVKEVLDLGVDGIFCDCFGWRPCYCSNCTRDMLAQGIDIKDDKAVMDFSYSIRQKTMERVREVVPRDIRLFFNGTFQWEGRNVHSHYEVECLPARWGYDFFAHNAAYARPLHDDVIYMNGRFQISWGDFGGYKGKVAIENDFYDALTQGTIPMLGDHLHPANLPETDIYRDLGEIYGRLKKYEKWTDEAKFIPELAIVTDDWYLSKSIAGCGRLLSELKYSYDVINVEGDFSKYPVIILPDNIRVNDAFAKKLSAYIKNGGKVISSGFSGLKADVDEFALPEWNFDCVGLANPSSNDYAASAGFMKYYKLLYKAEGIADMCYAQYETAISMKCRDGAISLADEYNTYFEKPGWDGRHYYFYTPPKEASGNSVIAVNKDGNVAHVAFRIFLSYIKSCAPVIKDTVRRLLERFIPKKLIIASDMPVTSRVTLTGCDSFKLLHVKVTYPEIRGNLGIIEEHNELAAGKTVAVLGEYKSVSRLPEKTPVKSEIKDGYTYVTLPLIKGYDMFILE